MFLPLQTLKKNRDRSLSVWNLKVGSKKINFDLFLQIKKQVLSLHSASKFGSQISNTNPKKKF